MCCTGSPFYFFCGLISGIESFWRYSLVVNTLHDVQHLLLLTIVELCKKCTAFDPRPNSILRRTICIDNCLLLLYLRGSYRAWWHSTYLVLALAFSCWLHSTRIDHLEAIIIHLKAIGALWGDELFSSILSLIDIRKLVYQTSVHSMWLDKCFCVCIFGVVSFLTFTHRWFFQWLVNSTIVLLPLIYIIFVEMRSFVLHTWNVRSK